jgi:hypothetical protein
MGVDAVLMVENSLRISLEKFLEKMPMDDWGKRSIFNFPESPDFSSWIEFEWKGKCYFSLVSGVPRYKFLIRKCYDFKSKIAYDNPDFDSKIQIPFLKIALSAEKIAGGPVHLGNDVIYSKESPEDIDADDFFTIPMELDSVIPEWRKIAIGERYARGASTGKPALRKSRRPRHPDLQPYPDQ